ncbi:serine-rich aggregation substance UasX [Leuconostoc pseudomesenteroides]|uniref:Serine-rich aggregation substance UasX n=1 Tax=Leuconostoc pseudomesenteroides TaxID=33968 RepID=A0ABT6HC47_LEUPS|nr:serine-rich aggregation substance UasX [Leuconostoc pseudomesenteroides]MDG9733657.1 serine-rich aggregation substance UasX [Leuconostoc pseudomesenteroides]NKZ37246.1 serine-rich aggregation substance UasX [Leuconostoc pseudomesenteroides]QQB26522.1 serine-rich aggregation substance UasX [Leuconostoc pseudomesenteroides]
MLQKQLLIAGSVLGALALGHQAVNADTVPTTDTSKAQSVQTTLPTVKAVVLNATDVTTSDASSTVDDGTTVDNGDVPNDDGTNTDNGGGSAPNDDGTNTDNGGGSSSNDDGTNTDNGDGSSSNDDGTNTDNGGSSNSSDNGGGSSSSDNGGSSSSSDNGGSSSSNNNGGSSSSDNGSTSHVVPVTPDNNGNVVNVPTQVASDADVSNAVKAYNQALADNGKDASNAKVKQAKENLDKAIDKALPKTHAIEKSSMGGSGILALATSGLVALGGLIYKRKHL